MMSIIIQTYLSLIENKLIVITISGLISNDIVCNGKLNLNLGARIHKIQANTKLLPIALEDILAELHAPKATVSP